MAEEILENDGRARQLRNERRKSKLEQAKDKVDQAKLALDKIKRVRKILKTINYISAATVIGLVIAFLKMNVELVLFGVEGVPILSGLGKNLGFKQNWAPLTLVEFIILLLVWFILIIIGGFIFMVIYFYSECNAWTVVIGLFGQGNCSIWGL
jgi:hypothetical protein